MPVNLKNITNQIAGTFAIELDSTNVINIISNLTESNIAVYLKNFYAINIDNSLTHSLDCLLDGIRIKPTLFIQPQSQYNIISAFDYIYLFPDSVISCQTSTANQIIIICSYEVLSS